MTVRVFGIRHHGPGSARSLLHALEGMRPDAVLVEGPPDAGDVLSLMARPEMVPPVALLVYPPGAPQDAACALIHRIARSMSRSAAGSAVAGSAVVASV